MTYQVGIVAVPEPDDGPSEDMQAVADLQHRVHLEESGHDDWGLDAQRLTNDYRSQQFTNKVQILARDGGQPVGTVVAWWDKSADPPTAFFNIAVPEEHFSTDLINELWAETRSASADSGARSVQCWIPRPWPNNPQEAAWLTPAVGTGAVPRDDWSEWLLGAGFTLEQASAAQLLQVEEGLQRCHQLSYSKTPGYATKTWRGPTPEDLVDAMVAIHNRMPHEAPNAGFDDRNFQETAERLRVRESRTAERGEVAVTTVVLHEASGEVVGFTVLQVMPTGMAAVQDDTLVLRRHRGHRLGRALKVTNLREMAEHHPDVERVHTWNAAENTHMIAINAAIGFRENGVEAGWQWRPPTS
ncbi:hypothetical protein K0651_12730 [Ornithinimicrobium sp. Arc0846-15]|nr:hypothetical protein [Ornithinimicrobium laminariae]